MESNNSSEEIEDFTAVVDNLELEANAFDDDDNELNPELATHSEEKWEEPSYC